jgi:hypothetical protein
MKSAMNERYSLPHVYSGRRIAAMSRTALLATFSLFLLVSPSFGAIEPPYKEIDYCYRIENIQAYPTFSVIARFSDEPDVQLKSDECFARRSADEIMAIAKDGPSDAVRYSGVHVPVSPVKVYNLEDPRKKIEDVFTIDILDEKAFSLRLVKKIVQFDDGTVLENAYATAEDGLADPPGPAYRYTDTPASPSEEWSGDERLPIRNDCYPGEDCFDERSLPPIQPWIELAWRIFNIVLGVIETIALISLVWSAIGYGIVKGCRSFYRKAALFSLLALIAGAIIYVAVYYYT